MPECRTLDIRQTHYTCAFSDIKDGEPYRERAREHRSWEDPRGNEQPVRPDENPPERRQGKDRDTTRTSARRWLKEAGIQPIAIGRGRTGAIRYRWPDIVAWLESRQHVE